MIAFGPLTAGIGRFGLIVVIQKNNDYATVVITAVREAGGDVLKLIGVLEIFEADDPVQACRAALRAEK